MTASLHVVPVGDDNLAYLFVAGTDAVVVDPGEAAPVAALVEALGVRLTDVLITHHHADHTGGVAALAAAGRVRVHAHVRDAARIVGITNPFTAGDPVPTAIGPVRTLDIPGHTTGHVAYVFDAVVPAAPAGRGGARDARPVPAVCTGDTVFSLGAGRLFEGTAAQMWDAFTRIRALDPATLVCPGHEYTAANARFCREIDPANRALDRRAAEVAQLRAAGLPSVPVPLAVEAATNPFMRADDPVVAAAVGLSGADAGTVWAALRTRKDRWVG